MPRGIFGKVAQDVGELQRAAEFGRNALPGRRLLSENPNRESADSDRHAFAVSIEQSEARRPNVGADVHFHAVDNGQEIAAP